jgi:hypothetical protein
LPCPKIDKIKTSVFGRYFLPMPNNGEKDLGSAIVNHLFDRHIFKDGKLLPQY